MLPLLRSRWTFFSCITFLLRHVYTFETGVPKQDVLSAFLILFALLAITADLTHSLRKR